MTRDLVDQMEAKAAFRDLLGFMTLMLRPAHSRESNQFLPYCKVYLDLVLGLQCSPTAIKATIEYLKSEWTKTGWPTPGELTKIIRGIEPVKGRHNGNGAAAEETDAPPEYSQEHRERMCAAFARLKLGLNHNYPIVMTAGEWSDWCKHNVKPEDLEHRIATKTIAPDCQFPKYARFILETAP